MSKSERECAPEVLTDEQLEIVSGGALVISAPVANGGLGELDPALAPRCGTHPGVIRR